MSQYKIIICEDNVQLKQQMQKRLNSENSIEVVDAVETISDLNRRLNDQPYDLLILDIELQNETSLGYIGSIKQKYIDLTIVVYTVFEDTDKLIQAIASGADGYLLKSRHLDDLVNEIFNALNGRASITMDLAVRLVSSHTEENRTEHPLSQREYEVLKLMSYGFTYREAADELNISPNTVRTYIRQIYEKLQVNSRSEAIIMARRQGWLKSADNEI